MTYRQHRPLNPLDVSRARMIISEYGRADLNSPNADLAGLVKLRYNRIRGIPVENLSTQQLYSIAVRLRNQAYTIVNLANKNSNLERKLLP